MTIFTIGYGGRSFNDLVEILKQQKVTHLVDVRTSPYSKFAEEFNRDALERTLPEFGPKYIFMGASSEAAQIAKLATTATGGFCTSRLSTKSFSSAEFGSS